jgi:hypothetical protein
MGARSTRARVGRAFSFIAQKNRAKMQICEKTEVFCERSKYLELSSDFVGAERSI